MNQFTEIFYLVNDIIFGLFKKRNSEQIQLTFLCQSCCKGLLSDLEGSVGSSTKVTCSMTPLYNSEWSKAPGFFRYQRLHLMLSDDTF